MVRYTSLKKAAFGLFLPVLALQMHTTKTSHQYTNALARNNAIIALYRSETAIVQRGRSTEAVQQQKLSKQHS